jgi:hypothetical protein
MTGSPRNQLKETEVKKIALTLVAVSALSLAACQGGTEANTAVSTDAENAINQANSDLENAQAVAANALDTMSNQVEAAGAAVENATDAASAATDAAAENATK